jgi:hypothetical protein
LELCAFDFTALNVDLKGEKHSEKKLVVLIKTSARVFKHFICQILNDVLNPFGRDWRLLRSKIIIPKM